MSLTLTAVDNGSKSATFSVAGAGGLATIRAARWNGASGPQGWGSVGTIAAPSGSLTVDLPAYGAYICIATANGEVSSPFYLNVVNTEAAHLTLLEDGIAETIKRLNLPQIGERVYAQLVPHDQLATYPCVFVTSNEGIETVDAGASNMTADIGHPVRVLLAYRGDVHESELRALLWLWRQRIWAAFDGQRITGVPRLKRATVEFGPRIQLWTYPASSDGSTAYEILATILTIRCSVRQLRGFGN